MTPPERATSPLFRCDGTYWGFHADHRLYDRYGRQVGWLEATPHGVDVYHLSGRFMGEFREGRYVLRSVLRREPAQRAGRPGVPYRTPPEPTPDRDPWDPTDDWADALPWPLRPPEPPRL
jgi:hypothetical protein